MDDSSSDDLQLDGFQEIPSDQGLSLDELSDSFARLLGQGKNPYEEPDESSEEETVEQIIDEAPSNGTSSVSPKGIIEAVLFVGHPHSEPISARYIASLMQGVRAAEVVSLVLELNSEYEELGSPYEIESIDHGFRMVLREEFGELKRSLAGKAKSAKLSQAAIDLLAVVAYHQPIRKERLRSILGKSSGRIAGQLIRRGLLRMEHAADAPSEWNKEDGHRASAMQYATTERFLALFSLDSLDDLPTPQDFERF